jgi:hypothetical protein
MSLLGFVAIFGSLGMMALIAVSFIMQVVLFMVFDKTSADWQWISGLYH